MVVGLYLGFYTPNDLIPSVGKKDLQLLRSLIEYLSILDDGKIQASKPEEMFVRIRDEIQLEGEE